MSITHSWNGTVLTITSDSGTSSVDLKGDTGCRGPQGPAGIVYGDTGEIVLDGYATEAYVDAKVADINVPQVDMTDYYTKSEVDVKVNNIDIPEVDLTDYATQEYVDEQIVNVATGGTINLDNYYTKTETDEQLANVNVAVDGKTIKRNDLNELETTIGGYYRKAIINLTDLDLEIAYNGTYVAKGRWDAFINSESSLFDIKVTYGDGTTETGVLQFEQMSSTGNNKTASATTSGLSKIRRVDYLYNWTAESINGLVFASFDVCTIDTVQIYQQGREPGYVPIDGHYIPVDGVTIGLNAQGQLTVLSGTTYPSGEGVKY